jgi:hypothetical protein
VLPIAPVRAPRAVFFGVRISDDRQRGWRDSAVVGDRGFSAGTRLA